MKFWTTKEVAVLLEEYPRHGARGVQERLPHRAARAINLKAMRLGIKTTYHWRRQL